MKYLKGPFAFIASTMFLNAAGLTIIIPVIPYIVARYTSDVALYVGLIVSVGALCQFLGSTVLGYASDRFGRRPILLWSLLGGMVGYILFGIGGSLLMLFAARAIDGLTAGDTPAMYAFIADTIQPKERARYYGVLGAAGGFGFMVGPAIGGLAAQVSLSMPLYIAAVLALCNALWGYFVMPESLKVEHRIKEFKLAHLNPLRPFKHVFTSFTLRVLFAVTFLFFTALIMQQSNISVFLRDILHWGPTNIGIVLALVGVVDIASQGYLTGKLLPRLGEIRLVVFGLIITALGECLVGAVAFIPASLLLYVAVVVYTLGDGFFEPAMSGLISNASSPEVQGRVQGANQGTQAIARVAAPLIAAGLYQLTPSLPYFASAILIIATLFVFMAYRTSFTLATH